MGKDMQIPPAKQRVRPLLAREATQILVLQLIPGWSPGICNQTLSSSSRMMQSSWYSAWKLSQVTALYVLNRLPISSKIKSLANKSAHLIHPTFLFLCYEVINLGSLKKKAPFIQTQKRTYTYSITHCGFSGFSNLFSFSHKLWLQGTIIDW